MLELTYSLQQAYPGLPLSHHRKVATSFRDQSLLQIFQISITSLRQLNSDASAQGIED
jgi:exportin-7